VNVSQLKLRSEKFDDDDDDDDNIDIINHHKKYVIAHKSFIFCK